MEPRFAHDFSRVRVHADERSAALADALGARAFTVGRNIAFAPGAYAPTSPPGSRLLVHELAHVVQQERGGNGEPSEAHEQDASAVAKSHEAGAWPLRVRLASGVGLARQSVGGAGHPTADVARERLVRAMQRGDAIEIGVVLRGLDDGDRQVLRADKALLQEIDRQLPSMARFNVQMMLQFGPTNPDDVRALKNAAYDRDSGRVMNVLRQYPRLRDPEEVPGVRAMLDSTFQGLPAHDVVVRAATLDVQELQAFAEQSPRVRELEQRARRERRSLTGMGELDVGMGTEPGQTFTRVSSGEIVVEPGVGKRGFAIRYAHELLNVSLLGEMQKLVRHPR